MAARLVWFGFASLSGSLIRTEYHIGANRFGVAVREFLRKRNHSIRLQHSIEHDMKPLIARERARITQIGQNAAADRNVAVALGAVALKERFAAPYRCWTSG